MQTKQQNQLSSEQLINLSKKNIDQFLQYFNVQLQSDNVKYYGICPIHENADNPTGIAIYKDSGIWQCFTHHCEGIFGKSILGFIAGLLSHQKRGWQNSSDTDKLINQNQINDFIGKLLNKSTIEVIKNEPNVIINNEKSDFIRQTSLLKKTKILGTRESIRKHLEIPSKYYLDRGYSAEILDRFDVGILKLKGHQFNNCTIIPVYDYLGKNIVGLTARNNIEKCMACGYFHKKNSLCLDKANANIQASKWRHSTGFIKEKFLFNYWNIAECIQKTQTIIICEGPGSCIRLEEAGFCNSVGMFGSKLTLSQANLIKKSNIKNVIILSDNDPAGEGVALQIQESLGKDYSYKRIELERNDIADYTIDEIKKIL